MESQQLVLLKNGQPIDLNDHPSLLALLHHGNRAMIQTDADIRRLEDEIRELIERARLHREIGLSDRGIKQMISRRQNRIEELRRVLEAFERNYLEMPNLQSEPLAVSGTPFENVKWTSQLGADVPMDVLRALKHAKEQGIFDEFRVVLPSGRGRDPVILAIIGDRAFYIASW